MLSDCLEEIEEQLSPIKIKKEINRNSLVPEINPLCSYTQENQLQMCIDHLENMFNCNEVINFKDYK